MPIKVVCQCGQRFTAKDQLAGRTVKCPKCSQPLTIPSPDQPESPALTSALDDLLEDAGLGAAQAGHRCPSCQAEVETGAVLCIHCGYDFRSHSSLKTRRGAAVSFDDDTDEAAELKSVSVHDNEMLNAAEREIIRTKQEKARMQKAAPWWVFLIGLGVCAGFIGYAIKTEPDPLEFGGMCAGGVFGFWLHALLYSGACNVFNGFDAAYFTKGPTKLLLPNVGYSVSIQMIFLLISVPILVGLIFAFRAVVGEEGVTAILLAVAVWLPVLILFIGLASMLMIPTSFGRGIGIGVCYVLIAGALDGLLVGGYLLFTNFCDPLERQATVRCTSHTPGSLTAWETHSPGAS